MRIILATLFLVFISTSFALGVPKRFGKQISIHSLHLEKISSLGSALKGLIQLADVHEFDALIEVVNQAQDKLNTLLNENVGQLGQVTQDYEDARDNLQANIANLESELQQAQAALEAAEAEESDYEQRIVNNNNAIDTANNDIATETARRQETQEANQQHRDNIRDALQAVEEAKNILQEIQAQDLVTGGSFIQMQKKKFSKALTLLQKKVSKTKLRLSPTEVYIKQLISIAQDVEAQTTVNAAVFDQIFVLVQNLEVSLENEDEQTRQADQDDAEASQNRLDLLSAGRDAQQADLAQNEQALADVQDQISRLQASIVSTGQFLADAQENLANVETNYAVQSETLQGYIDRLQLDLEVLARANTFLQSAANDDNAQETVGNDVASYGPAAEPEYAVGPALYFDEPEASPLPPTLQPEPEPELDEPVIVGNDPATWSPFALTDDEPEVQNEPEVQDVPAVQEESYDVVAADSGSEDEAQGADETQYQAQAAESDESEDEAQAADETQYQAQAAELDEPEDEAQAADESEE